MDSARGRKKSWFYRVSLCCALVGLGGAFFLSASPTEAVKLPGPASEEVDVEQIINSMTLAEKVGQLMVVGFGGTEVNSHIEKWVRKRKAGGVILFARNIENLKQVARFTRELHGLTEGGERLFVGLEQEGGNVSRLKD